MCALVTGVQTCARPIWTCLSSPSLLRPLGAVLGTTLATILHALGVERAADDVIADARQVLHTTAADHHHRVLLQVMALAGNVAADLEAVGQEHGRHLTTRNRKRQSLNSSHQCAA